MPYAIQRGSLRHQRTNVCRVPCAIRNIALHSIIIKYIYLLCHLLNRKHEPNVYVLELFTV